MSAFERPTSLDLALRELFLEREDLRIKTDITQQDPFSLGRVFSLLQAPVQTLSYTAYVGHEIETRHQSLSRLVVFCGSMLELPDEQPQFPREQDLLPDASLHPAIKDIYTALVHANRLYAQAFSGLTAHEVLFVKTIVEQLLFQGEYRDDFPRMQTQERIEQAFMLALRIDMRKIGQASVTLAAAIDRALPELKKEGHALVRTSVATPMGAVIIGGSGNDRYDDDMPLILIEPGGDDAYSFKNHSPFSILIDLSGNDTYSSTQNSFLGAGMLGLGFLIDMEGDDLYQGEVYSFGCGFMGAGVVADFAGDDRYTAKMFSQGSATFGIGLLYDRQGNDFYQCGLYGQGMGYVSGAGVVVDMAGDDTFLAGAAVPDSREKGEAFQTYAQGFGMGCRQYASGGVGLLYNGRGSDIYQGSYFCQGSSYWHSLGMLLDANGDDRYTARRYSQGAGVHSSVGVLSDGRGSDVYTSWGVSQGCGHDYGLGMLYDGQGNDRYEASWLSRGAGSSAGVGVFIDDRGNDSYTATGSSNLGAGTYDERRDMESLGIFIDREGDDVLPASLTGKKIWRQGAVGAGTDATETRRSLWDEPVQFDLSAYPKTVASRADGEKSRSSETGLLPELEARLFLEDSWEKASTSLAGKGPSIIPALCAYLAIKDISLQRTVEETFKKLGKKYLDDIHHFLIQEDTQQQTQVFLLYVLGDIQNKESKDVFLRFLSHGTTAVQAMALRGLCKLHEPPPDGLLQTMSQSASGSVRRYLCLALGASDEEQALKLLCQLLGDGDFQVRHAAYRVLGEKREQARSMLKEQRARNESPPSVCRMIDELLGDRKREEVL